MIIAMIVGAFFVGVFMGMFFISLLSIAKRADECMECAARREEELKNQFLYIVDVDGWGMGIQRVRDKDKDEYWLNISACGVSSVSSTKLTPKDIKRFINLARKIDGRKK